MDFGDTVKGLIGKGKQAAADNSEQIQDAIEKAADFADDKTGGKYSQHIDKAAEAAKKVVPTKE